MNNRAGAWIRILEHTHTATSTIPVIAYSVLLVYAIRVRTILGRWPVVYKDDPTEPFLKIIEHTFQYFYYALVFAFYAWPVMFILLLIFRRNRRLLLSSIAYCGATGLFILANYYDFTGFFEWFWD